jgi:hypothetical protein
MWMSDRPENESRDIGPYFNTVYQISRSCDKKLLKNCHKIFLSAHPLPDIRHTFPWVFTSATRTKTKKKLYVTCKLKRKMRK